MDSDFSSRVSGATSRDLGLVIEGLSSFGGHFLHSVHKYRCPLLGSWVSFVERFHCICTHEMETADTVTLDLWTLIRNSIDKRSLSLSLSAVQVTECLTTVKKINKTDAGTLINSFKVLTI